MDIFRPPSAKSFVETLRRRAAEVAPLAAEGARGLPRLLRKPALAGRWLLGARAAQIALLLVLLTTPVLLPRMADVVLESLYPPVKKDRLFGLVQTTHADERLEKRKSLARIALWSGSGGMVLLLLVLRVPAALRKGEDEEAALEAEGDALAGEHPDQSLLLFRRALKLAVSRAQEQSLAAKIAALAETAAHREDLDEAGFHGEATVIGHPLEPLRVGPEGRYLLEGELGRGAMGIVYRARDEVLERTVALKELPVYLAGDGDLVARFRREARILAQLQHPNIVQIYDLIEHGGHLWLAMEMVEGDLDALLQESGSLGAAEAARLGAQIADALAHAHARGIIHRDIKTANVLLGAGGCPKVTDFGLAKLSRSSHFTQEGAILGSPVYMSPEQAAGKGADERSDIYALGIVLYKLLTGRPPFEGDTASVLAQQITQPPLSPGQLVGELPGGLETLLLELLAKDPVRRPQEMAEVAAALRSYAAD